MPVQDVSKLRKLKKVCFLRRMDLLERRQAAQAAGLAAQNAAQPPLPIP